MTTVTRKTRKPTATLPAKPVAMPRPRFRSFEEQTQRYNDAGAIVAAVDDMRQLFGAMTGGTEWAHDPATKRGRDTILWPHVASMLTELERIANELAKEAR